MLPDSRHTKLVYCILAHSMIGKNFTLKYFSQKMGFDISCKSSPKETICMKCKCLFSGWGRGGIRKNSVSLLSAELAQRVVKVKVDFRFSNT